MNQDYVTLARVKGYSRARVLLRVALRNALIPALTLTGVQFTFLVGGTVLIEYIFAYPGIGNLAIGAVIQRDLPLIQGLILTFAVLFIITNLAGGHGLRVAQSETEAGMKSSLRTALKSTRGWCSGALFCWR